MDVSHFSNALQLLLDGMPYSRAALAERVGIPASSLHGYFHGLARPDVAFLEKLCSILEPQERVDLIVAHLRDETPPSAADLIQIVSLVNAPRSSEDAATPPPKVRLPKKVREDFDYLEQMAALHPEVVDSLRATVRILRGR